MIQQKLQVTDFAEAVNPLIANVEWYNWQSQESLDFFKFYFFSNCLFRIRPSIRTVCVMALNDIVLVIIVHLLLYAMLFSRAGERRIRVHSLSLPVSSDLSHIYARSNVLAITVTLANMGEREKEPCNTCTHMYVPTQGLFWGFPPLLNLLPFPCDWLGP